MTLAENFKLTFELGCEMWTSEDGTLLSLAIMVRDDWKEILQKQFAHIFEAERFREDRAKQAFAYREWVGSDFYAKDAESWAFESFCRVHPHEAFETWPERFWHREHPNITREQMEALLAAVDSNERTKHN